MAKATVVHSTDAVTVIFNGDIKNPEPSTGIIKFPGGHVEVSRTSNGEYWVHTFIDETAEITGSRIDYRYEKYLEMGGKIPPLPAHEHVQKVAVRINWWKRNGYA